VVSLLLSRGADPNSADRMGNTPLMEACSKDSTSMAQVGRVDRLDDGTPRDSVLHASRELCINSSFREGLVRGLKPGCSMVHD
jgi:hypothetical protein